MTTTVVHVNNPNGFDVYCGRAIPGRFPPSKWANPWKVADYGRTGCIERYKTFFPESLREAVGELRGLRLGCWCCKQTQVATAVSPVPYICHCQFLAALADGIEPPEELRLF